MINFILFYFVISIVSGLCLFFLMSGGIYLSSFFSSKRKSDKEIDSNA